MKTDPADHCPGHREVAARAADQDRRRGRADLRGRLRDLRPRQRDVPRRGARAGPGRAADLPRPQRAVDGARRGRLRQGDAWPADHDRDLVDRSRLDEHGHRRGRRPRQPPAGPALLRRHVPAPDRRPGAPAGRAFRRPDADRDGHLQAGEPLLGSDHEARPDRPVAAAGPRRDARPGDARPGLLRAAPGRPGRGVRLPGAVLRAEGPLHPPAGAGSARRPGRRGPDLERPTADDRGRRRGPLLGRGGRAADLRGTPRHPGRRDRGRQVDAHPRPPELRRPDRRHGVDRGERRRGAGRRRHRRRDAAPGLHDGLVVRVRESGCPVRGGQHGLVGCPQAGGAAGHRRRQGHARGDRRRARHVRGPARVAVDGRRAHRRVARLPRFLVRASSTTARRPMPRSSRPSTRWPTPRTTSCRRPVACPAS